MPELFATLHWGVVFQIILVDILLGGDNAVVIALACRGLAPARRMHGILWGTAGAIVLRVALISFALVLLDVPFLKIIGCALLLWIGIKLMLPGADQHDGIASTASVMAAVKTIILADFAMSLDNVIAIAGAAQNAHVGHQMFYVIFGLLVSVPIIVWGSTLVLRLMDRFPLMVTLGAGLLGWIAGGMLVSDVYVVERLGSPTPVAKLAAELTGALVVIVLGRRIAAWRRAGQEQQGGSALR
ncbi:hypothetical protein CAL18_10730 [Bordetella genomosp. 7]|uniref:Tellurium resistance protein TerC n=1 Tax=Bordetella genomosp. 7 TaxID=1416805 RepID=A0A261QXZ3_9BORD|nr:MULTISPECIES: TerC family protein [Bordetella]OZI17634.1 hypothetical protein CAL19_10930 [Bordetella genomosp. 7]OZI22145.1 hypothetical protein CAL18_10730 [Bordetella genomosp. 7]